MITMPKSVLAIDPGLRACGLAVFEGGVLIHATLVDNPVDGDSDAPVWTGMSKAVHDYLANNYYSPEVLVIERPQVYGGGRGKGDPNDLLSLMAVVGGVCASVRAPTKKSFYPRVWKGQVPKNIHNDRILERLSAAERKMLPELAASKLHNVIDAVGLGLYELERL